MIQGIDHIEFVVRDIDETAEFFTKLGFTEIRRTTHGGGSVEMRVPGTGENPIVFEFHLGMPGERAGIDHIAFRVENTEKTVQDLIGKGVKFAVGTHAASTKRVVASFRDPMYVKWQLAEGRS